MSQYPNSGTLGANEWKQPNQPRTRDERGKADITCPHCHKESHFEIAGWIKKGPKGDFLSLSFKDSQTALREKEQRSFK